MASQPSQYVAWESLICTSTHEWQVDMDLRPKFDSSFKPDFMAPGPKVEISKSNVFGLLDSENSKAEPLDAYRALDQSDRPVRYYKSENALGQLYRMIDERQFYENIQKTWQEKSSLRINVLRTALFYVLQKTRTIQYDHHKTNALEIRDIYETHINNAR